MRHLVNIVPVGRNGLKPISENQVIDDYQKASLAVGVSSC